MYGGSQEQGTPLKGVMNLILETALFLFYI